MSDHSPTQLALHPSHSPTSSAKRPKGILKNANGVQHNLTSPRFTNIGPSNTNNSIPSPDEDPLSLERPGVHREMSDKEITLQNTLANAGPRRNSSNARSSISGSRRHSSFEAGDGTSPRLKWDEANLWHAEQERDSTMKIDEPKTPYAPRYDPAEDEDEVETIDASALNVDELDMAKAPRTHRKEEIPDLNLGEPEVHPIVSTDGEKRVIVDDSSADDGLGGHGEERSQTAEAKAKHLEFEERRKKHYEMKNVKGMLGHPAAIDDDDMER